VIFWTNTAIIPQAYPPILLERKAAKIRKSMDEENAREKEMRIAMDATDKQCDGHPSHLHDQCMLISLTVGKSYSVKPSCALSSCSYTSPYCNFSVSTWHLYMVSFIVRTQNLSVYAILHFSVFLTTIPTTFQDVYHDRVGIAGLHYLALGVGLLVPSQFNARLMDKVYKLLKARNGGVGRPEFRLREYRS
jgi:hypothetical protein